MQPQVHPSLITVALQSVAIAALCACSSPDAARRKTAALPVPDSSTAIASSPAEAPDARLRCDARDGFASFERPDKIWLSVRADMEWDTAGAGSHTDTLTEMEVFKLARTKLGYVYFDNGPSDDPTFTLLDVDSAHVRNDLFSKDHHPKTLAGSELRILDDSTVEACGIADTYINHARSFRLRGDSLAPLGCRRLDAGQVRTAKADLLVFKDSSFTHPACTIKSGDTVQVARGLMKDPAQCVESDTFLLESRSCSGWYEINRPGTADLPEPVTDLYYHGD